MCGVGTVSPERGATSTGLHEAVRIRSSTVLGAMNIECELIIRIEDMVELEKTMLR